MAGTNRLAMAYTDLQTGLPEIDSDWLPTVRAQDLQQANPDETNFEMCLPRADHAVILILGEPRAGSSQFIQQVTGSKHVHIRQEGESWWDSIRAHPTCIAGLTVSLVELPDFCFDVNRTSDIAQWLASMYRCRHQISGIIYLYPINQGDDIPSPSKLQLLENLFGLDAAPNVLLLTTNWNKVPEEKGLAVEHTHVKPWWKPFMDRGSAMLRWFGERESAFEAIHHIIGRCGKSTAVFDIQREIVVEGKVFSETGAGKALSEGFERRQKYNTARLEALSPGAAKVVLEGEKSVVRGLTREERQIRWNLMSTRLQQLSLQNCTSAVDVQEEVDRFLRFAAEWERRLVEGQHRAFLASEKPVKDLPPPELEAPAPVMSAPPDPYPWGLVLLLVDLGLLAYAILGSRRSVIAISIREAGHWTW
jgi:hypothetical protein